MLITYTAAWMVVEEGEEAQKHRTYSDENTALLKVSFQLMPFC
jgi:hypothetical protein